MKLLTGLSALASLASAASVDLDKRDTPLEVKLENSGNSGVKAYLTNNGAEAVKLFTTGTFLDEKAVEKVEVYSVDSKLAFDGIRLTVSTVGLTEESFKIVKAGETIEMEFDAAELHDLSAGGDYEILTKGAFSTAELDSTVISGVLPYSSNSLSSKVDGIKAATTHKNFQDIAKRTTVSSDCTGTRRSATITAINKCASLASAARAAATSDTARLQEYFKSSSSSVSSRVAAVFSRIEEECGSTTSGISTYHCTDVYNSCKPGVIAYTLSSQSFMVNCDKFFNQMPPTSSRCHAQDQQTTILHEMTHLSQIAGTSDYGGYGYNFVQSLTAAQNLNHADTYTLFAQSIFARC
ncbi:neutral protease [Verticillium alfalfae VaMs.102]|uniref:Neutral protease 2 n=1 Tax=Verticillium alfalfae (strain VaMs.102 / ATCC MYA-4576 / FGSC 10136) TaxID=526221 RepID=C9SBA3_VERA1|nr:neutral protease [Verticillium alfalfae VaMs.102]EEY16385.1 neutral protease [Verticillium alfalfae VaMs.102]